MNIFRENKDVFLQTTHDADETIDHAAEGDGKWEIRVSEII